MAATDLNDIRVWIYPGASPDADPSLWGTEEDVSSKVRRPGQDGGQAITYSGGRGDEAAEVDNGRMSLALDDRDGRFSTDNIAGPYHGKLDTNTPIRMGVAAFKDSFTRTASNGWGSPPEVTRLGWSWGHTNTLSDWSCSAANGAGTILATANLAANAVTFNGNTRDMDLQMTVVPTAVATGARFSVAFSMHRVDSSNQKIVELSFNTDGTMWLALRRIKASSYATFADVNPIPSLTYTANSRWRLRAQVEGAQMRAKVWLEGTTEPSTWLVTTDNANVDGVDGSTNGIFFARYASNTNSGVTPLVYVDDYQVIGFEFTGFVSSWPVRWDKSGNNSWSPITAEGMLARITQGNYPIQSPLRRHLGSQQFISDYWPLEEGPSSKSFAPIRAAGQPAYFSSGVTLAADNELAGGGPAPTVSTTADFIQGVTNVSNNGTGFAAMFLFKLGTLPAGEMIIARFRTNRGPIPIYDLSIDGSSFYTKAKDVDGTVISSAANAFGPLNFTEWMAWQLETDNSLSPGNTVWKTLVHQIGDPTFYFQTGTVSGGTNSIVNFFRLQGPDGTAFGHLWLGRNTLPFASSSFSLVSSGYEGEAAAVRWKRIAGEIGLPAQVRSGDSEAMGIQRESDALSVLRAAASADYAVMAERGAGLEFIPRTARWNPPVDMALVKSSGHLDRPPEPTRDLQRFRNKWTVTRLDGGSATFQDDASAARSGTIEDSAMVNVASDAVLVNHAAWRTFLGTRQRMRWPSVSINLVRAPLLIPSWRKRRYGMRFTVSTGLTQVRGFEPDLIFEGFNATLTPDMWEVDMNASEAGAWKAAVADGTGVLSQADIEGCTVASPINSSTLTIPITTATGKLKWDNTAGLWTGGVNLYVGGECVTVTSITNGAGQAQTLNCSARGVGGYSASHVAGEEVRLWEPAIVAF